jgi:hypothetical protein
MLKIAEAWKELLLWEIEKSGVERLGEMFGGRIPIDAGGGDVP